MRRGLTLTAFNIDDLIDKSDRKLFRQATQPVTVCTNVCLVKPPSTVLISFPLFSIHSLKTLISIIVCLNMYNPLIVILCFFISSYYMFYALCFIFCVFH